MPQQDTKKANFDRRAKKLDSIRNLFSYLPHFLKNIFNEISLCEYCHGAFLESVLNFEHFKKRAS